MSSLNNTIIWAPVKLGIRIARSILMKRAPSNIRRDLRNWLDQLYIAYQIGEYKNIKHCKLEVCALEKELVFNRYGRTDVH